MKIRDRRRLLVGLTGGIGSGKSLALSAFRRRGATTISSDEIAHEQARTRASGYRAIVRAFGGRVLDSDGRLDRAKLSAEVFVKPAARRRLEAATHPIIMRELRRLIGRARGVVVADVPLLFEKRLANEFDFTILVTAPRAARLARLKRRGLAAAEALRRMKAQLSDAVKARRADVVVPNAGSKTEFLRRVGQYHAALTLLQQSPT
ncbi:MAG: dephospho-CoA kinase [Elusimicrobia bacterium]|nr:dephospho-CoA kinase [Elusimicrobiota bacterium]